jgi:hypothetical protein
MTSVMDVALAPVRLVMALPRVVEGLERLPDIADSLERIAAFEDSLKRLEGLATAVAQLERAAGDLTQAVQPLQGVAQRLSRFGRG